MLAFLDFSRNRLAVGHEPPGGLCVLVCFLGSLMNRLAAEDGQPGDTTCVFPLSRFDWFVSDAVIFWVVFLLHQFNWHDKLWFVVTKLMEISWIWEWNWGWGFMRELGIIFMSNFNDWCVDYPELTVIWILYEPCMVCVYRNTLGWRRVL